MSSLASCSRADDWRFGEQALVVGGMAGADLNPPQPHGARGTGLQTTFFRASYLFAREQQINTKHRAALAFDFVRNASPPGRHFTARKEKKLRVRGNKIQEGSVWKT